MIAVQSVGWNLGTFREFGGAAGDTVRAVSGGIGRVRRGGSGAAQDRVAGRQPLIFRMASSASFRSLARTAVNIGYTASQIAWFHSR